MANETTQAAAASALTIEGVRKELKGDIAEVKGNIAEVRAELRGVASTQTSMLSTMGEMRGEIGTVSGELGSLPKIVESLVEERKTFLTELAAERQRDREEDHLTVKAQIDVDRHAKIAEIDDTKNQKKARRDWVTKGLAIVSTLAAIVLALLHARSC
jgi:regulator of replication initiation timing